MSHVVQIADFVGEEAYGAYTPAWGVCASEAEAAGIVASLAKVEHPEPAVWYATEEPVFNASAGDVVGERVAYF